ncbi:phage tail assembly protein [Asaia astilbis]|uniref:phage tail assembly protein n=1 Tax=Asaia astilbis TaxID=610244 RepID=UPI00047030C3|nr:phage tail assembly protein [Asaia astilbis]
MPTEREIPEYLTLSEDGTSITVKLSRPVELDGVKRDTVVLREPTAGEQKRYLPNSQTAKAIGDAEARLIAYLSDGLTPTNLDALPARDYTRLLEAFSFFTD